MAELEKALGSRLYPHYGSRECGLMDYRVSFDGSLMLEARVRETGLKESIRRAAQSCCPEVPVTVQTTPCRKSDRPMYLGKWHIVQM